jgi:6-phosphogluconolactonase
LIEFASAADVVAAESLADEEGNMRDKLFKTAFAAAIVALANACQPGVYVANGLGNSISGYTRNVFNGALTPIAGSPFATGSAPSSLALTASYLYVANGGSDNVSVYNIDRSTRALTPIPGSPFVAGSVPRSISIDPSLNFAYLVNNGNNNVSVYNIDHQNGALTPISGSPFPTGLSPQSIVVGLQGVFAQYAYVAARNGIFGYTINVSTGGLTPIPGSPFAQGTEVSRLAIHPSGAFLYAVDGNSTSPAGVISGYTVDCTTGALALIARTPRSSWGFSGLAIDPSGRLLYASAAYAPPPAYMIGARGILTATSGNGLPEYSEDVTIDPSGFVYALVLYDYHYYVAGYTIDAGTGALTPVPGGRVAMGHRPSAVITTHETPRAISCVKA